MSVGQQSWAVIPSRGSEQKLGRYLRGCKSLNFIRKDQFNTMTGNLKVLNLLLWLLQQPTLHSE